MGHVLNIYQPKWSHTFSPQQQCLLWILIRAGTSKCHGSNMSAVDTMYSCSAISSGGGEGGARCGDWLLGDDTPPWYKVAPVTCTCSHGDYISVFPTTVILHDYSDYMLVTWGTYTDSFRLLYFCRYSNSQTVTMFTFLVLSLLHHTALASPIVR